MLAQTASWIAKQLHSCAASAGSLLGSLHRLQGLKDVEASGPGQAIRSREGGIQQLPQAITGHKSLSRLPLKPFPKGLQSVLKDQGRRLCEHKPAKYGRRKNHTSTNQVGIYHEHQAAEGIKKPTTRES